MSKIYKYKGEDISEEFVTEGFEQSSFTILDDYIANTDGLEVIEEVEDFQNGTVGTDAPVVPATPSRASIIAGVEPESMELEQVDTSLELEDPEPTVRKGRAQVRQEELQRRKIAEEQKIEKDWSKDFASSVASPNFSDLNQDQVLNIQNKAIEELTSQYKDEEEYSFDDTDIRLKAVSIFENKVLPKVSLEKDTTLEKFIKEKAPILNPYADFISDIYTAGAQGLSTSGLVDPTFELLKKGSGSSDEDIITWIEANKKIAAENMQSDEMRDFNKIYEENGSGVFGFIKGVANNPSIMPSLLVSSIATQIGSLRSEEVALSAAAAAGTGAVAGSIIPGAGTITGAIGGAIGGGAAAMEASLTFSELLQQEVGEDLNLKAVRSLFEDEEKVADLQRKAVGRGIAIGLVEGLTGSIAKGVTGKVLKAGLKKPVATVAGIGVESVGGGVGEIAGRIAADQEMDIAEIGFEAVTGTTTAPITVGSELINLDNRIANYKINKELKNTNFSNIEQAFSPNASITEAQVKISQNKKAETILDNNLKKSVLKGDITQKQADETKRTFLETQGAVNNIKPLKLNDQDQARAVDLITEKKTLQQEIKRVNEPSLTEAQSERISEIDNSLKEIGKKAKAQETKKVEKVVSQLESVGIKAMSTEEVQEYLQSKNLVKDKEQAIVKSGEGAFIVQDQKTGEQEIIVNKDLGSISDPSHEALHAIIFKTVNKNPEAAVNLGKALQAELNKIDENLIKDSGVKNRLELYKSSPESVQMEEVLTLFSDAIRTENIKFDENVFTKIGDFIRQVLQKAGIKAKFNKGRDVFNFVRDYQKSIESGKLTRGQVRAAKEGIKGKLITEAKQVQEAETIVKESRSEESSQEVQRIYEEQGEAGAFDIIEQFKPIVNKIVEQRSQAPNFDRQLLTDEIETGKRGIFDLIREYKPESGVPLAAYINKFLPARAIEASKRVLGEEFTEDVTEARGVVAEAAPAEVVEERVTRKIKPTSLIPVESVTKIKERVTEKIKEIPADKLTFKKLGDLAPEVIAEAIGIPVKKLVDPKANLSKGDASAIQRFVNKNADRLLKLLPEGAVLEAATEKLIGTSTGVPKGLLNAFYTKQERIGKGAGLAPFKKNPNITKADFLKAFGIVEGKKAEDFSARSPEAQALKGIANLYGRLVTNEVVRSEADLDIETKQDIAAGKSRVMFSKSEDIFNAVTGKKANMDFNDKKVVEELKVKTFNIFDKFSVEDVVKYLLPVATKGYNYNFKTVDGKKVFVNDSKNTRNIIFQGRADFFNSYNKYRKSKGLKPVKFKPNVRSISFVDSEGQKQTIKLAVLKNQSTIGVKSGKFFETLEDRISTAQDQRSGLKKMVLDLKDYVDKNPNDTTTVPMILTMLNSNTDGLVRTAAIPKWIMYDESLKDSDYIYEHTQTASDTVGEIMRAIYKSKNKAELLNEFDVIMENFDVAIIPRKNDALVNKSFKNNGPRENDISKKDYKTKIQYPGEDGFPVRYRYANELNNAGIELENISNFSKDKKAEVSIKESKASKLDKTFNDILEKKSGIPSRKRYGVVEAITKGASKGKFNFFIPPSAEDFVGLLYPTLAKGEVGDAQMSWYKKNLIDPYAEAMNKLSKARVFLMNNYNLLKSQLGIVPKNLSKKIEGTDYTREQAIRVYIWNKQKMNIPGISDKDISQLSNYVADDANLQAFADQLINMQLGDGYVKPKEGWPAGTITTDILEGLNTTKRAKYLNKWQENVDEIFSEENLNKLQAIYGLNYRKALENMLKRMKSGRNRSFPGDSLTGRFTDWLTGSVGAIMFFNTRSAILQTISSINFINFTDNNILAAGKAFANQKQYWSDFMKLINSDFLKERRGGLRINVNEADIADMAKKGGVKGAISKLLELGFAPTQIADSFAIASGGATFYRNRIKTYKKQGLSDKQAEKKAFEDFRETAEESQQSSRADRISMQQAGPLGRVILAFANTPAQYARIIKKAASDLKNGRGDAKTNISKIIYYGAVQNLIFNALQQALFAIGFGDEEPEDEEKQKKYINIANGMLDSLLRGAGIGGSIVSVGKNAIIKLVKELEKDRPKLQNIASEIIKISPPVSAKYSRLVQAGKSYDWNKEEMKEKGLSLDNPAYLAGANVVSALTNIPLDRVIKKANNVVSATSQDLETWERLALLGGWQDWEIGIEKENKSNKPQPRKVVKKKVIKKKLVK